MVKDMDDATAQLIAEQLGRFKDALEARIGCLEDDQAHNKELTAEKLQAIKDDIAQVKEVQKDHETRLRSVADSVISLRTTGGLIQAGQAALTILAASIAAWLK
jgi:hypothetical protein